MKKKLVKIRKVNQPSMFVQSVVSFVIPIIILTRFSSESQLGPTKGLLLALAFPIVFELYNVHKRKKLSMLSVLAIVSILTTGAVGLLGLSEGWLAVRRSLPYLACGTAITISVWIKHPILNAVLPQILDMEKITSHAQKKKAMADLDKSITRTSFILGTILFILAVASYVLTVIIIMSEPGTTSFNEEYAKLRILSLPFITLPTLIGLTGATLYLLRSIEKLTGLDIDGVTKKK